MAGVQHRVWRDFPFDDRSRELIVDLSVRPLAGDPNDSKFLGVSAKVFFKDAPGDSYIPPALPFGRRTPLMYRFQNGDELRGWLLWSNNLDTTRTEQIFGRLNIVNIPRRRDWHYEGFMMDFGPSVLVPVPAPDPEPLPNGGGGLPVPTPGPSPLAPARLPSELETRQARLSADELFPFLYIQDWPSPGAWALKQDFIVMPKGLTTQTKFLTDVEAQRTSNDPSAMRATAVAYINERVDPQSSGASEDNPIYPAAFIANLSELPAPFKQFPEIWFTLNASDPVDFKAVAEVVKATFGGWETCNTSLQLKTVAPQLGRIWSSVIALNLVLGYRHTLLADLIRVLIVYHLLVEVSQFMLDSGTDQKSRLTDPDASEQEEDERKSVLTFETDHARKASPSDAAKAKATSKAMPPAKRFARKNAAPAAAPVSDYPASEEPAEDPTAGSANESGTAVDSTAAENGAGTPLVEPAFPPTPKLNTMVQRLLSGTLALPGAIFPLVHAPKPPTQGSTSPSAPKETDENRIRPYAMGAARAVRYEPLGYELGEVQRIENVLRGEVREKSSRNLVRRESEDQHSESDQQKIVLHEDQSSSDLINQVQKTLSDHVSKTNINNYDTTYGMPTTNKMSVSGEWWIQEQPAGGFLKDAARFARDVLERTVRRISKDVSRSRLASEISEFESRETSRFENINGDRDIRGVYRWVNRTYRLQTQDLGERLIIEILIDNPAEHLIDELSRYYRLSLRPPVSPRERGITDYAVLSDVPLPVGDTEDNGDGGKQTSQQTGVQKPAPTETADTSKKNPDADGTKTQEQSSSASEKPDQNTSNSGQGNPKDDNSHPDTDVQEEPTAADPSVDDRAKTVAASQVFYLDAFEGFGVKDDLPPPPPKLTAGRGVRNNTPLTETRVPIPDGYTPDSITITMTTFEGDIEATVIAGTVPLDAQGKGSGNQHTYTGRLTADDAADSVDGTGKEVWVAILCRSKAAKKSDENGTDTGNSSGQQDNAAKASPSGGTTPATNSAPKAGQSNSGGSTTGTSDSSQSNKNSNKPDPEIPVVGNENVPISYYAANITITCVRTPQTIAAWQYKAYRLIDAAYREQLETYRTALERQRTAIDGENPQFLADAVSNQIIQSCIARLYGQHEFLTGALNSDTATKPVSPNQNVDDPLSDGPAQTPDFGQPRVFQYLRNAFLWSELNAQLYMTDADDAAAWMSEGQNALLEVLAPTHQFRNFLRAKRARILVPVRPGWTMGVQYFLQTGLIWPDADELTPCLESDRSMVAELKRLQRQDGSRPALIEDSWIVELPTSMVMLSSEPLLPSQEDVA